MAKYSKLLAKLSGMSAREVNLIEATAPLHDIGKIATPDAILNKPGKLNEAEMNEMRRHAQHGYDMLADSSSELLKLGALIALTHHERWDGTGYPNRMSAESIPLAGRIVSLADVFDALMSQRVYKEPLTFEDTLKIIEDGAGKHFDPELVVLFKQHADEFHQIFIDNPDSSDAMVA
jgi:putative two-component system response regulator